MEIGAPAVMLAADEALLEAVSAHGDPLVRWYVVDRPAVVLGFAQRARRDELLDSLRCSDRGVEIVERRAGGGLVLLDPGMLCLTVGLPGSHPLYSDDLTESYRWLGDALAAGLGVQGARRVEVEEARQDVAALRKQDDSISRLLLAGCFAALSPHEVVMGSPPRKVVGLAQVRRKHAALFQVGILLRDQSPLADLVRVPDEPTREGFRAELCRRTVGFEGPSAEDLAQRLSRALPVLRTGGY